MTRPTAFPPVTCDKHASSFLLDVLEPDGAISHLCTICQTAAGDQLLCVNVVRGLYRRTSDIAAERKDTGT